MYKVVSIHPCMIDTKKDKQESTPVLSYTLSIIESEALNDIGLKKDKVITSLGNFNIDNNGDNKFKIKSIKPLDIIILDAKIIAKIDGNKFKEILIPSLIPLINDSYIFIFL